MNSTRWTLKRELGVEYPPLCSPGTTKLEHPILAERADDGTTLIVDRLGNPKGLPFWMEYRTLRVAPDGHIIYDSHVHGIQDGYGCLTGDGGIALLRVSKWEIQLLSSTGRLLRTIGLSYFAKQPPVLVSSTDRDTLLVAFVDRAFDVEIIEVDLDGKLLWYLPGSGHRFGFPGSLQRLPNNNLLIADAFSHAAIEIDRDGNVVWQFGTEKEPGKQLDQLTNPHFIRELSDGRRLIADTRNHRVLSILGSRVVDIIIPHGTDLRSPISATPLGNGNTLISDAGNACVFELDAENYVVWQFGESTTSRRWLSFPRSVEYSDQGTYLVADTANDRVVEIHDGTVKNWPTPGAAQLFWPRCARKTVAGTLLVADGRNSRIVELSGSGEVLNELRQIDLEGGLLLGDPHDIHPLPDGNLLVVDPGLELVAEVSWLGQVHWSVGRGVGPDLKDPHSAQRLNDGLVLICDTGNSRILWMDRCGEIVQERGMLRSGSACYRLNRPRYVEISSDGTCLIVDTGNNRILAADPEGELIWELSKIPDSRMPLLSQPRWAQMISQHEVIVVDHYHHRVLHLRRE